MKCAHAPRASYNTPPIELIQYGRRIGKKVYRLPSLLKTLIKMLFFCYSLCCISTADILDQES